MKTRTLGGFSANDAQSLVTMAANKMTTLAGLMNSPPTSFASYDLEREWKRCCLDAMGLFDWDLDSNDSHTKDPTKEGANGVLIVPSVMSLLPPHHVEKEEKKTENPWMETAISIHQNIFNMHRWIDQKKWQYVSIHMPDEEASLIQTTVTSFAAQTASEIESLRKLITDGYHYQQHQTGVVQILLSELKETVAEPFGKLQKQRSRTAVKLWQNPLSCHLVRRPEKAKGDEIDAILGIADDKQKESQKFLPKRPSHRLHRDFMTNYSRVPVRCDRPVSLFSKKRRQEQAAPDGDAKRTKFVQSNQQAKPLVGKPEDMPQRPVQQDSFLFTESDELEQETAQLQLIAHSDLDSVQKIEEQMVDITSLLSQFSNLLTEQQDHVMEIHETTKESKKNVEDGQDQLVAAKEATVASRHLMAKAIFGSSLMLLFFHWVRP